MASFLKSKQLYRTLAVYLGSSWVLIEAGGYFIDRYQYPDYYKDVLTVLLFFGLLSFLYNAYLDTKATNQESKPISVWPHLINVMLAVTVAYFVWDNAKTNYIKFKANDSELVSIAVLPFENVGPDSTYYWMGDAICGELISHLNHVNSIDVKSKSASFYFKDKDYNPVQIAGLLGINSMLDGSIMVLDSTYRITVSLSNPLNGSQLWNEQFEGKLSNIFDLQSQIALSIADKISADVSQVERERILSSLTNNKEAEKLYMKGKYHYHMMTPVDIQLANQFFRKAIELDEEFVMAHGYLGMTYDIFGGMWLGLVPDSAYQIVDKIANQILVLDKDNAMGKFLKANVVYFYQRDYNQGVKMAKEAYLSADNQEDLLWIYALMISMNRQADEAIELLDNYISKNPTSALAYQSLCHARLMVKGRDKKIPIEYFNEPCFKCMELDPSIIYGKYLLAELHFLRGEFEESRKYWQEMAEAAPIPQFYEGIMRTSLNLGDTSLAMKYYDQIISGAGYNKASPYILARVYSTLYEIDSVVKYLEMAYSIRDIEMVALWNEPAFDNVRDEPKFQEILSRMQNTGPVSGKVDKTADSR